TRALWPWMQVLRGLRRATAAATGADGTSTVCSEVAHLAERVARQRAVVIAIDDAEEADDASLLLTELVARTVRRQRIVLAVAYRDVPLALRRLAPTLRELLRASVVERVRVAGLDHDAVVALSERVLARRLPEPLVAHLHQWTDGNPLLLTELL